MRWTLLAVPALFAPLAGCKAPPAPPSRVEPPAILSRCPEGAAAPVPPPAPRTVEAVAAYANAAEAARGRTEHARTVCATRLQELNAWIRDHL